MGKSVAYFMKWAKLLPISRNGQFQGLGITYTQCIIIHNIILAYQISLYINHTDFDSCIFGIQCTFYLS